MKRPEEGALGSPVLAGNPATDLAGVGRSVPSAAIAPQGATQADRAVELNSTDGHWPDWEPGHCNLIFSGFASSSEKILDGC